MITTTSWRIVEELHGAGFYTNWLEVWHGWKKGDKFWNCVQGTWCIIWPVKFNDFWRFATTSSGSIGNAQCYSTGWWIGKARRASFARQTGLCRFILARKIGPDGFEIIFWACLRADHKITRRTYSWTSCHDPTLDSLCPSHRLCKDDGTMVFFHWRGLWAWAAFWRAWCHYYWW